MEGDGLCIPDKVSFIFTPAEEFIEIEQRRALKKQGLLSGLSGKQDMIASGLFDDVDVVLSCHIMGADPDHPDALFDVGSRLAGFLRKRAEFKGRAAHSGVAPHLGCNALHAASLSLTTIQMLKDTFSPSAQVKLYLILSEGGGVSVNMICSHAASTAVSVAEPASASPCEVGSTGSPTAFGP
jgi:metal-dependent amidase/aminoacylase/carboxypeptidase family protein